MEKLGHGIYTPMDVDLLPPLYLIYAENPSDSGKVSFVSFDSTGAFIFLSASFIIHSFGFNHSHDTLSV